MLNWIVGKVVKNQFWSDTLFTLNIIAPIEPFIAGQFTKLSLRINGKYVQRAYSYVNAPNDPNLEFYLVVVRNGKLSPMLAKLRPGDEVRIMNKATGFFVINEIPNCDTLWMLATGTALGPYLSILEYGVNLERFKNIVLVHAVRYASHLNYLPRMLELEKRYAGKLRIQTVVSRETTANSLIGRIPDLINNNQLETMVGLSINPKTSHVMLCGNPGMVHDTQKLLKEKRRMNKHLRRYPGHVTTEYYW